MNRAIAKPARKWPAPAPMAAAYSASRLWLSRRKLEMRLDPLVRVQPGVADRDRAVPQIVEQLVEALHHVAGQRRGLDHDLGADQDERAGDQGQAAEHRARRRRAARQPPGAQPVGHRREQGGEQDGDGDRDHDLGQVAGQPAERRRSRPPRAAPARPRPRRSADPAEPLGRTPSRGDDRDLGRAVAAAQAARRPVAVGTTGRLSADPARSTPSAPGRRTRRPPALAPREAHGVRPTPSAPGDSRPDPLGKSHLTNLTGLPPRAIAL